MKAIVNANAPPSSTALGDESYLPFIKQHDLGQLQNKWQKYSSPNFPSSESISQQHLEEESHSVFTRDFPEIHNTEEIN